MKVVVLLWVVTLVILAQMWAEVITLQDQDRRIKAKAEQNYTLILDLYNRIGEPAGGYHPVPHKTRRNK